MLGIERRRAERHLIGCPECRRRLTALTAALEVLHAAAEVPSASSSGRSLWPELSRQIQESRRCRPTAWRGSTFWPAAALAASLALTIGSALVFRVPPRPETKAIVSRPEPPGPRPTAGPAASELSRPTSSTDRTRPSLFDPPPAQDTR